MKELFLLFSIFILLLAPSLIQAELTGEAITGESVTGEATAHGLGMGIYVIAVNPSLEIISPKNGTYISQTVSLEYFASNCDSVWYNLDSGQNQTLSGNASLKLGDGLHTFYIYANNSQGNVSKNVIFSVEKGKVKIKYEKWSEEGDKSSTNFNSSTYEDLQNLSDVFFKYEKKGGIFFNVPINLTKNLDSLENSMNFDDFINVSYNHIEIDSENLPGLNESALLYLEGLPFSNPRILMDGVVCPSTVCSEVNYSGGAFYFNVNHFTTYSTEETPASETQIPSGNSAGGRAREIFPSEKDILVSSEELSVFLKQGETDKKEIIIQNKFNQDLTFSVESEKTEKFFKLSESNFLITSNQNKTLSLDFIARDDAEPGLYFDNLIIKSGGIEKKVLLILEIKEKNSLFDVSISFPKRFEMSYPGEEVFFYVNLINLGAKEREDVILETSLKNRDGKTIFSEEESFAIETKVDHVAEITLPTDLEDGKYFFSVEVKYSGGVAFASKEFSIKTEKALNIPKINMIFLMILLSLIIFLFIFLILSRGMVSKRRKK